MRRSFLVALCLAMLAAGCRLRRDERPSGEGYDAAVRLGGEFFNCDRLDDAGCAVALMHIPPTLQGAEREGELQGLRRGIRLLRERFGGVAEVKAPTTDFRMAEVYWAGGTAGYWAEHPQSSKATFPVKFAKLSDGYVQIEACKIGTTWQIRAIHYGLPASNPSSAPMIAMINDDLSKVSQP